MDGSPKPVGGLSLLRNCTSISGGACVISDQRVIVEVGLHYPPFFESDLLPHHRAHSVDDRALTLVKSHAGIDDLTANIGSYPNLVDLDFLGGVDPDLGNLGEAVGAAEAERDAQGGAFRKRLLPLRPSPTSELPIW